jgi:hypothetical protein
VALKNGNRTDAVSQRCPDDNFKAFRCFLFSIFYSIDRPYPALAINMSLYYQLCHQDNIEGTETRYEHDWLHVVFGHFHFFGKKTKKPICPLQQDKTNNQR